MRGTFRKDRHGNPDTEPEFELVTEMPPPPGFLDDVAVMEWKRVGPELVEKQLLTVADLAAFTLYCLNVSRVVAAERMILRRRDHDLVAGRDEGAPRGAHRAAVGRRGAQVRPGVRPHAVGAHAREGAAGEAGSEKPDDPWAQLGGGAT
jgi:hypothetical protein